MNKLKLELKAYKCVFPSLFEGFYTQYMWRNPLEYDLIWGKNQKEAVRNKCLMDEGHSYWELKQAIRTRRFKEADLYSQEPSPILEILNGKEIDHLLHSLGVEIGDCYNGDFYREYSVYCKENEDYKRLIKLGLVKVHSKFEQFVYTVTEKGKEAVKTLLLIKKPINNE